MRTVITNQSSHVGKQNNLQRRWAKNIPTEAANNSETLLIFMLVRIFETQTLMMKAKIKKVTATQLLNLQYLKFNIHVLAHAKLQSNTKKFKTKIDL